MAKSLRPQILEMLIDEDTYISGQELSDRLGVSRTAIWKHINALKKKGYQIDSVPNKGYCLVATPNRLVPEEVARKLKTEILGKEIVFYQEVGSTNTKAKEVAADYKEGTIFLAEAQSQGRGRLGRNWSSMPGKGIWCSVLLKPELRPRVASLFPLITSVAIAEAIHHFGIDAKIKWPNDLLIDGKKICGILTEMGADMDKINYLVVGFGLNVKHQAQDFPEELQSIATSLEIVSENKLDRVEILTQILYQLEMRYQQFIEEGFEPIRELWKKYTCTLGHEVKISRFNEEPLYGRALDLNSDGSLKFELEDGEVRNILSGEIGLGQEQ